jgi:hypothetical protein
MKAEPNPDRFLWGVGELVLLSHPNMTAEQIKAWNDEQRALGLKAIAAEAAAENDEPTDKQWAQLAVLDKAPEAAAPKEWEGTFVFSKLDDVPASFLRRLQ